MGTSIIQVEREPKEDGVVWQIVAVSYSDELGVGASRNNGTRLAVNDFPNGRRRKSQGSSHLAGFALDFNLVPVFG